MPTEPTTTPSLTIQNSSDGTQPSGTLFPLAQSLSKFMYAKTSVRATTVMSRLFGGDQRSSPTARNASRISAKETANSGDGRRSSRVILSKIIPDLSISCPQSFWGLVVGSVDRRHDAISSGKAACRRRSKSAEFRRQGERKQRLSEPSWYCDVGYSLW